MSVLKAVRSGAPFSATGGERPSLVWLGLLLAGVYWILESTVHVVAFGEDEFLHQLLTLDPHEVWKRLFVALLLVVFSLYAQRGLDRRRHYEKSLRSAHAELNQIFQTASVAMRLIDHRHRVLKVNETFSTLTGLSADEAVGGLCFEGFAGDLCHTPGCPLDRILQGAPGVEVEVDKRRRDGSRVTCALTARPFLDENGERIGVVESFQDVTETKAAQAIAIRSEQLAALGELAAGVAHEINNPINGIINYGEILASRPRDPETVNEVATQIVREGARVAGIVRSLLSFARRDAGQRQSIELGQILDESLTLTAAQLRKDGIRLALDLSDDLPRVACVPQEIEQVFLNILNNARYALVEAPERSEPRCITVTSGREVTGDGCCVRLSFHDNGTGIPRPVLDKVTHPFFSTKPRGQGTGLGLSISHGIVTDHGGRLEIESVEGEFTRVTMVLPALGERLPIEVGEQASAVGNGGKG